MKLVLTALTTILFAVLTECKVSEPKAPVGSVYSIESVERKMRTRAVAPSSGVRNKIVLIITCQLFLFLFLVEQDDVTMLFCFIPGDLES